VSGLKFSLVLVMFLILASQFFISETFAQASKDVAASALTDAEGVVVSAYQAVLRAEEAGANVSGLLVRLNEAGGFLARARMAYDFGDFEEAAGLANSSRNIGVEVENAAVELKDSAFLERVQRMWFMMLGSIFGVVLVFFGSFWVWRVFKRRYYRRVLMMKPEVSSNES
jgi:hypothetical protein